MWRYTEFVGSRSVLLVEDNPIDVKLVQRALRDLEIGVTVKTSGDEAIEYLHNEEGFVPPDLILLDIKMPRVDGFQVLEEIRRNKATEFVPVVMLSSSDEDEDVNRSYRLGANSFVRKVEDYDQYKTNLFELSRYWLSVHGSPELN